MGTGWGPGGKFSGLWILIKSKQMKIHTRIKKPSMATVMLLLSGFWCYTRPAARTPPPQPPSLQRGRSVQSALLNGPKYLEHDNVQLLNHKSLHKEFIEKI